MIDIEAFQTDNICIGFSFTSHPPTMLLIVPFILNSTTKIPRETVLAVHLEMCQSPAENCQNLENEYSGKKHNYSQQAQHIVLFKFYKYPIIKCIAKMFQ